MAMKRNLSPSDTVQLESNNNNNNNNDNNNNGLVKTFYREVQDSSYANHEPLTRIINVANVSATSYSKLIIWPHVEGVQGHNDVSFRITNFYK